MAHSPLSGLIQMATLMKKNANTKGLPGIDIGRPESIGKQSLRKATVTPSICCFTLNNRKHSHKSAAIDSPQGHSHRKQLHVKPYAKPKDNYDNSVSDILGCFCFVCFVLLRHRERLGTSLPDNRRRKQLHLYYTME